MTILVGQKTLSSGSTSGGNFVTNAINTAASGSSFLAFAGGASFVGATGVTDSNGNHYDQVDTTKIDGINGTSLAAFLCTNGTGGAGHTATIAFGLGINVSCSLIEILGGDLASLVDVSFGNGFIGQPYDPQVTTTFANTLIISACNDFSAGSYSYAAGGGFSILDAETTGTTGIATASRVVSATGTYGPSFTQGTGSSNTAAAFTVALKAAASAPTLTDVNTDETIVGGSSGNTFAGTNLGATSADRVFSIVQGATEVTQTQGSGNATSGAFTSAGFALAGLLFYGSADANVETADGEDTLPVTLEAPTGYDAVTLTSVNAVAANRITAISDLAIGNQLEWGNIQGVGTVVVNDDATFDATATVTAFDVRAQDGTGWGAWATQSIQGFPDATSRNYYMTMQRQVPNAIAITPSDSTTYKPALIALRVGTTAGTLVVRSGGATVTIPGVLVGETIYVSCNQVMAASTAVGITGFQWPD